MKTIRQRVKEAVQEHPDASALHLARRLREEGGLSDADLLMLLDTAITAERESAKPKVTVTVNLPADRPRREPRAQRIVDRGPYPWPA